MANPLYDMFGKNQVKNNAVMNIMNEIRSIQQTFKGNPKNEVEKLLNSGAMSQEQFNEFGKIANQILGLNSPK